MGGSWSAKEPDEAWVGEHLEVERLDDEYGGGVAVWVCELARQGADADADVAKTDAWLQAHGREVKVFEAESRAFTRVESTTWCHVLAQRSWMCGWMFVAVTLGGRVLAQSGGWVRACTSWHEACKHAQH